MIGLTDSANVFKYLLIMLDVEDIHIMIYNNCCYYKFINKVIKTH